MANMSTASNTRTMSRTLMFASSSAGGSGSVVKPTTSGTAVHTHVHAKVPPPVQPVTATEQYWAARALTAETLLSARSTHQEELRAIARYADEKRAVELSEIQRHHEHRHARLERLIHILLGCLVVLCSVVVYSLSRHVLNPPKSSWSIPSHFTIPILSPFTSVIEHETSFMSTRVITIGLVVSAVLAYGCFRYWLWNSRRP